MKKMLKNKGNFIIGFIIGMVVSGSVAYAASKIYASNVTVDTTNMSELSNNANLNDVLDYLYEKASKPKCEYTVGQTFNFSYTGDVQIFDTKNCPGVYMLEVWGARGGGKYQLSELGNAGLGGYSVGNINLGSSQTLYVQVGGQGSYCANSACTANGGYNGGGYGIKTSSTNIDPAAGGGGATDIRIGQDSLYARVIVAGGGGGGGMDGEDGAAGGGTSGVNMASRSGASATQTTGYAFGKGADATIANGTSSGYGGPGAGGGWYGGQINGYFAGGGGSGYIYTPSTASNYPSGSLLNSSNYLFSAETKAGNETFNSPTGVSEVGHAGNGYARITLVSIN